MLGDLATTESLMFELGTLEAATNNFSLNNKLGEGGFGSVYKVNHFNYYLPIIELVISIVCPIISFD